VSYATHLTTEELADQLNELVDEGIRKGRYATSEEWGDAIYEALREHRAKPFDLGDEKLNKLADLIRRT
jgi:hypothetical protein